MAEEEVKENEDKDSAESDEDEEDDEVTKAALEQLARMDEDSRLIMKGMADLTDAINKIADKVNGIEKQVNDEGSVVKSQLGNVKATPANAKSPVTQTAPSADQIQIPVVKSWIKEQFAAGNPNSIQINDVAALDSGYVSPKIKDLFIKSRGNK